MQQDWLKYIKVSEIHYEKGDTKEIRLQENMHEEIATSKRDSGYNAKSHYELGLSELRDLYYVRHNAYLP